MLYPMELSFIEAKKNLNRQATKILHDIVDAYVVGDLDDPRKAVVFCSLLACVCEGRVQGLFDEETGKIKWSLTEKAEEEARLLVESAVSSSPNIVPGPWKSE